MLSGGVIVASCAANDNGKTSSIAAVNMHFLGIILIMVTVPLLLRRLLYTRNNWTRKRNGAN